MTNTLQNTLLVEPPTGTEPGQKNDVGGNEWGTVQELVDSFHDEKRKKETIVRRIQNEYKDQFRVERPKRKEFLNGYLLFMVVWRTITRMKLLDFRIRLHGAPKIMETIVKKALEQGIEESGFRDAYFSKFGIAYRKLLFGDAFCVKNIQEKGWPTKFKLISIDDVWLDIFMTDMHSASDVGDADMAAFRMRYSFDEFVRLFPESEKKVALGELPFTEENFWKDIDYTPEQTDETKDREIEVLYFFMKSETPRFIIFAGKNASIISDKSGKEYRFRDKEGKPYIPANQFMCLPSTEGPYNDGLGSLFFKLHIQLKQLMNKAISAISNRIDPVQVIYMDDVNKAELENKILKALQDKAKGGMGVISLKGQKAAQPIQSLIGEQMTNEFERMLNQYDLLIKRIGINLDDIPQEVDTATQAQFAEAASNAFVQQIMEVNADEIRRVYEGILTDIRDFVDEDDETPIRADFVPVRDGQEMLRIESPTLGGVSAVLNKFPFEVIVEKRSGSYPDLLAELSRSSEITEILGAMAPGSPAHRKSIQKFVNLRGAEFEEEDFAVAQAVGAGQ